MSVFHYVQNRVVSIRQSKSNSIEIESRPPALWRRMMAGLIDRCLPLPFLAFFFPQWIVVIFFYHLLADSTPERRSFGKRVCRLRVVSVSGSSCHPLQTVARRLGLALTQTAWALWQFMPLVLLYELIALTGVLLSPAGRRPEDVVAGTRVVTEKEYRRLIAARLPERSR